MTTIVILINTLAEFEQEIPAPALVRLNLTERHEHTKLLTYLHVSLNLQGVSAAGHIVWLHDSYTLEKILRGDDFWQPAQRDIYRQMPQAQQIIRNYLTTRGYRVRGGQFGLPAGVTPVRGQFECLNWAKTGETYRVEAVTVESEANHA